MKILILGSGGREHTFAWKINQSPLCSALFIAPGNAGTADCGTNIDLDPMDFEQVGQFIQEKEITLLIVGPEAPLVGGLVDYLKEQEAFADLKIIGPSKEGAQLEGSKAYAKVFMQEYGIPTAAYQAFQAETLDAGLAFIDQQDLPIVLKADGLAAGKGVLICEDRTEAKQQLKDMLNGKFGQASAQVVIEAFLTGIEFSVFVLTDGKDYVVLPIAKDYKRIGENDTGLNTGGMGAVSPVSFVDDVLMEKVEEQIIKPTLHGIQERGLDYCGFIFLGLINVGGDPYVIEYNCRMGDPETQVVLPRLNNDLVKILLATANRSLHQITIDEAAEAAVAIILVSGGYPLAYEKGKRIDGLDRIVHTTVFHAGTKVTDHGIVTNGGRVVAICAQRAKVKDALSIAKQDAQRIEFEGKYFRRDIGFDL